MDWNKCIELLDHLSRYSLHYGILPDKANLKFDVNILNTDNTITVKELTLGEIMYFTENGTATIPGKFILEKNYPEVNRIINNEIELIVDKIIKDPEKIEKNYIDTQIQQLCLKVRDYIRNNMRAYISHANILGEILHKDQDDNKYLFDLEKLSQYIECVAKFEN